jgi:hypothetical protein
VRFTLAVVLVASVAFARGAAAQVGFRDLAATFSALSSAVAALPPELRHPRLVRAAGWLDDRWPSVRNPRTVSTEYLASIARAAELLKRNPTAEIVADVTHDLEAKVEHCRRLRVDMGGAVLVRVDTRRGAGRVSGLEVRYLLKFDEWLKTAPRQFAKLSSPTEMRVEPGRYWIWTRDPVSGATSDRVLVQVAGQKEMIVELAIP